MEITIDNKKIKVKDGTTILEAATEAGIKIPTLCHMHLHELNYENQPGACRICVVEVEGRKNLAPSCKTECTEGMIIRTHTPRVLNARRTVMELILSNHPNECLTCSKNGYCDLQSVAHDLCIRKISYKGEMSHFTADISPAIIRDMDKCIACRRCEEACNTIQSVGALSAINRGFNAVVGTAFCKDISGSNCTYCGQCVAICPTGALREHTNIDDVLKALADPTKTVIVQTAPAVRVALGKDFGFKPGSDVTGKMVTALRQLGFNKVFDTDFAADLTIMEEGNELLERITKAVSGIRTVKLPLLTSCCPAWVNYMEQHHSDLLQHLSTARSPQQMFGSIAKTYLAEKMKISRKDMVVVSIMPCVAKKYECKRPEFYVGNNPDVDISITTRELAHLIRYANIDFEKLEDGSFDEPMGTSSGAGVIFGTTGGVIEAAVRTAYELYTKETLPRINFEELRGFDGIRTATIYFKETPIRIGIAHGLANAKKVVDWIKSGKCNLHAIEVMACPGGCIGGGGQPYHRGHIEVLRRRQSALYISDANNKIRKSHENPAIKALYDEFLGKPCGPTAHRLLHTHYTKK